MSLPISLALRASYDSAVMSEQRDRVIAVGEAIVELVRGGDGRFGIGCAGDTFNVAVYLARAGINAGFATALGDDPYSEAILALAAAEGVACDLVLRTRERLPGLALVDTDAAGTRHRHDWRTEAPARELFELPEWGRIAESVSKAKQPERVLVQYEKWHRRAGSPAGQPRWGARPARESRARCAGHNQTDVMNQYQDANLV